MAHSSHGNIPLLAGSKLGIDTRLSLDDEARTLAGRQQTLQMPNAKDSYGTQVMWTNSSREMFFILNAQPDNTLDCRSPLMCTAIAQDACVTLKETYCCLTTVAKTSSVLVYSCILFKLATKKP